MEKPEYMHNDPILAQAIVRLAPHINAANPLDRSVGAQKYLKHYIQSQHDGNTNQFKSQYNEDKFQHIVENYGRSQLLLPHDLTHQLE